jgi:hypothetical protein
MRLTVRSWLSWVVPALLILIPLAVTAQGPGPLSVEEQASLREIQDFVRATAQQYRMIAPLQVSVASWVGNPALSQYAGSPAVYARGTLFLNRRLLRASNRDLVIATALAYELLRGPGTATSLADRERERAQLALESNARAVDILVQVKGRSEQAALDQMYAWLLGIHHAALASGRPTPPDRPRPCDAIGELLQRYPGSREWFAGRECAPA